MLRWLQLSVPLSASLAPVYDKISKWTVVSLWDEKFEKWGKIGFRFYQPELGSLVGWKIFFMEFPNLSHRFIDLDGKSKKAQPAPTRAANALFCGVVFGFIFSFLFAYIGVFDESENLGYDVHEFMAK